MNAFDMAVVGDLYIPQCLSLWILYLYPCVCVLRADFLTPFFSLFFSFITIICLE